MGRAVGLEAAGGPARSDLSGRRRQVADGTDIVFQWQVPSDPDGDKIADYHFELSNRPDMQWPLSTNFYQLISKTADRGKAQYTLPAPAC